MSTSIASAISSIVNDCVIDRGWPFTGESGEPRYRFNLEATARRIHAEVLQPNGVKSAWVEITPFKDESHLVYIDGVQRYSYNDARWPGSLTTTGAISARKSGRRYDLGSKKYFTRLGEMMPAQVIFADGSVGKIASVDSDGYIHTTV